MTGRTNRAESTSHRLRNLAAERGVDPQRLRRLLIFERMMARLGRSEAWVLKGGYCLEVRLDLDSRATRDIDVVLDHKSGGSPLDIQDRLDADLGRALPLDDGFSFVVTLPKLLRAGAPGPGAWRASVTASIDGRPFDTVKIDVVEAMAEVVGGVETIEIAALLPDDVYRSIRVYAVDVYQHAAEKFHAYGRLYAGDAPSSRVKDLVDLVLLAEAELLTDVQRLRARLDAVYAFRDGQGPPVALPAPPAEWGPVYAALTDDLGITCQTSRAAYLVIAHTYAQAVSEGTPQ